MVEKIRNLEQMKAKDRAFMFLEIFESSGLQFVR